MVDPVLTFIVATILVALVFDFFNGVNDAANSIATIVATRVLRPIYAVGLAAVFNFLGPFLVGDFVAKTVSKGIIDPNAATTPIVLAGLIGAIAWTWIATHYGIPISVSHSLIGGLMGSGVAAVGFGVLELPALERAMPVFHVMRDGAIAGGILFLTLALATRGKRPISMGVLGAFVGSGVWLAAQIFAGGVVVDKLLAVFLFIFYSPLLGFLGGYILNLAIIWFFQNASPQRMQSWFGRLQLLSASFYSLGHGTNDAQKTMGVITLLLVANGYQETFDVATWVIIISAAAISLGTLIGGYKVVRTMGMKLTHLEPYQGFSAETSSAVGLFFLAKFGVPVSTTHSIAGSIMGVGASQGFNRVRWSTARTLVSAWLLTIPAAAAVSWVIFQVLRVLIQDLPVT